MACIQELVGSYSTSVNAFDLVKPLDDATRVLVRDHDFPVPAGSGSCLSARIIGYAKHIKGFIVETTETSSISLCTVYAEQRASIAFDLMVSRVLELLQEEDELDDDYGATVPTKTALSQTLTVLNNAFRELRTVFPMAAATVSFDGGIRIQWMHPDSSLRLVVPGDEGEEAYIYYEHEDVFGSIEASASNLAERIRWLQRICTYAESSR